VRLLALRDDQQSRCVLVQAVHQPGAPGLAAGGPAGGERLHERAAAMAGGGVHDEARGLVDDQQVRVLVDDRQRRGLARRRRRRARHRHLDELAAAEDLGLARRRTVDQHRAELDPARGLRARAGVLGEEAVEPEPGCLSRRSQRHHGRSAGRARPRRS